MAPEDRGGSIGEGARLRIHLGLGSNLGERWAYLTRAVEALRVVDHGLVVSPVYETVPVGGPEQGPYLNCIVRLVARLTPPEVLGLAARLEQEACRTRAVRWGPRTLDVDVLELERELREDWVPIEVATAELIVPHPRSTERAFVLAPLEDLTPELVKSDWRDRLGGEEAVNAAISRVGEIVLGPH